jgi:hypothetical protein
MCHSQAVFGTETPRLGYFRLYHSRIYRLLVILCSFMGYEDLNVVDPTSGEAKAAETDLSDVSGS